MKRKLPLYCLLLASLVGDAFAGATIQLADGTTYNNAEVKTVESGSVLLMHSGGIARIPFEKLTRENRALLDLKPTPDIAKLDFSTNVEALRESADILQKTYGDTLQGLENKAIAAGEVDAVVEIREAIANLPDIKPESEIQFHDLRQARKEHAARSSTKQFELAVLLQELLEKYRETLQSIADDLVASGRGVEAASLKSEINRIAAMAAAPEIALVKFGITPSSIATVDPGPAPPETRLGRIVILPITETAKTDSAPATFAAVETANRSDIVSIGRTSFPNIGAILADGNLVYWDRTTQTVHMISGANTQCAQSHDLPLIGLDRDGTLNFTSDADADTLSKLAAQSGVVDMAATIGAIAFVLNDGRVSVAGPRDDHEHCLLLEEMENVRAVGFSGLGFVTVLKRDGSVTKIRKGEANEMSGIGHIAKLPSDGIGETKDGSLVNLGGTPQSFLDAVGPNPRQIFRENSLFCAIGADGKFHCTLRGENNQFNRAESLQIALAGALGFAPFYGPDDAVWIAALLPSEQIERSGLWEVEDLIAARR